MSKELVRSLVRACEACQSIGPATVRWDKGDLSVKKKKKKKNCSRLAMDVTHYDGGHFLTLIDCAPSRFAVADVLHRYHIRVRNMDATPRLNHK